MYRIHFRDKRDGGNRSHSRFLMSGLGGSFNLICKAFYQEWYSLTEVYTCRTHLIPIIKTCERWTTHLWQWGIYCESVMWCYVYSLLQFNKFCMISNSVFNLTWILPSVVLLVGTKVEKKKKGRNSGLIY